MLQDDGTCQQAAEAASKEIAEFATAAQASQLIVTRLDDDKAITNGIVRYALLPKVICSVVG